LSPCELYDLTPREFQNKLAGFEQLQTRNERADWEKFRMLATTLITPHTKKGKGIRPEILWPFDWDKKQEQKAMTKERLEYLSERSKLMKRKNNG
jgi:hypothetical protein